MSEEKKLLSIPEGLMSKADRNKMSFNIHDQVFISRVLGFHYEEILSKVAEDVGKIVSQKYDEQTATLGEVIINSHKDHMREVDKLLNLIKNMNKRVNVMSRQLSCHTKNIAKLKKVIEDIHNIKIDL